MKILLTDENRGSGGAERFTLQLGQELQARGHEVLVLTRQDAWLARQSALEVEQAPFSPEWDPRTVYRIAGLVRSRGIEVVHCQANRDLVAASLAHSLGMRATLIKTEHSFLDEGLGPLIRWAYRRCPCWVAVSQALEGQMFGRTRVIYNGFRPPSRPPSPPPEMAEGTWLVSVGSLIEGKGQAFLLEALRALPEVRLALVGDGPLRASLQAEHGDRVWWVGQVEDSLPYVAGATVAVIPSLKETFSLACLEAMALGKPVIASNTGGISELVEHRASGWLVSPGSTPELIEALRTVLASPELRVELGRAAAQRAQQCFSLDRMVDEYEALYRGEPAERLSGLKGGPGSAGP